MANVTLNLEELYSLLAGVSACQANIAGFQYSLSTLNTQAMYDSSHWGVLSGVNGGKFEAAWHRIDGLRQPIQSTIDMVLMALYGSLTLPAGLPARYVNFDTTDEAIEAYTLGVAVGTRLTDGTMTDQDWANLQNHENDPAFAAAVANTCPPDRFATIASNLAATYAARSNRLADSDTYQQATHDYQARLSALGITLGTATQSVMLRDGYADDVVSVFQTPGQNAAAMSVVLSYATCATGFATTVADGVYDDERADGFTTWLDLAGGNTSLGFFMPDGTYRTDAMPGILMMLSHNPEAAENFFSEGPSSSSATVAVSVDGRITDQDQPINDRLQYLLTERTWANARGSDEGAGLGQALESVAGLSGPLATSISRQAMAVSWQRQAEDSNWRLSGGIPASMDVVYSRQGQGVYPPGLVVDHNSDSSDLAAGRQKWGDIADYMTDQMNQNSQYLLESGDKAVFFPAVYPGHPWDHKSVLADMIGSNKVADLYLPDPSGNGVSLFYDTWSNIHYGYVGAVVGYNPELLEWGQRHIGISDAVDDLGVQVGVDLAAEYPPGTLTPEALQLAIDDHMFEYLSAALVPPSSQVQIWN